MQRLVLPSTALCRVHLHAPRLSPLLSSAVLRPPSKPSAPTPASSFSTAPPPPLAVSPVPAFSPASLSPLSLSPRYKPSGSGFARSLALSVTAMAAAGEKSGEPLGDDGFRESIPLSELDAMTVLDADGQDVPFGDLHKDTKTIVGRVPPEHLRGVRIVVVGCAPARFIKPFVADTKFPYDLYSDPNRELYSKLGLVNKLGGLGGSKSPHVKSSITGGILKSTWRGLKSMRMQGDVKQQGGALVLGPGDELVYAHQDANPADHAPIDVLLQAAGLEPFFGYTTGAASGRDPSQDAE